MSSCDAHTDFHFGCRPEDHGTNCAPFEPPRVAAQTPDTAPLPALPEPDYPAMIRWLQDALRDAGKCIDGGHCHHGCKRDPKAECFRQRGCVPLVGSGLDDQWQIPAAQTAPDAVPLSGEWEGAEEWMPLAWELCAEECGEDACTELVWGGRTCPRAVGRSLA